MFGLLPLALDAQSQAPDAAIKQCESCHCAEAAAKIESAARQGSVLAMRVTGGINEDGKAIPRSHLQAVTWYRRAVAAGAHSVMEDIARGNSDRVAAGIVTPGYYEIAGRMVNQKPQWVNFRQSPITE